MSSIDCYGECLNVWKRPSNDLIGLTILYISDLGHRNLTWLAHVMKDHIRSYYESCLIIIIFIYRFAIMISLDKIENNSVLMDETDNKTLRSFIQHYWFYKPADCKGLFKNSRMVFWEFIIWTQLHWSTIECPLKWRHIKYDLYSINSFFNMLVIYVRFNFQIFE